MKTKYIKHTAFLAASLFIASCTNDMEYKDAQVTAVDQIFEPADEKVIELSSSSTASLFFEWAPAKSEDNGSPLYEVVFDKEGGNFSKPVYRVLADNNGTRNYATVSHKDLNKAGKAAGINSGETGTIIWSVVASRGLNSALATEARKLTVTCLKGFETIPNQLYLTGEATEGGNNIAQAVVCSAPGEAGMFEIFTKLEGGKTYKLVENNSEGAKSYYVNDKNIIIEGEGETAVAETGVYRIQFNFTTASVQMTKIKSLGFFFCPDNEVKFDIPYKGNGVFEGQGVVNFKQESWGRDQRYKFLMIYADDTRQMWGTKNTTDSNAGAAGPDDPYFFIAETPDNQWDQKWKLNDEFDGANTKISLIFNGENYTHHVELAN